MEKEHKWLVMACLKDYSQVKLMITTPFEIDKWIKSRIKYFRVFDIIRIEITELT